jgi:hypothetical protein
LCQRDFSPGEIHSRPPTERSRALPQVARRIVSPVAASDATNWSESGPPGGSDRSLSTRPRDVRRFPTSGTYVVSHHLSLALIEMAATKYRRQSTECLRLLLVIRLGEK